MLVAADLHLHSRYSRGTSDEMTLEFLERCAEVKGLQVIGTGDFTHPRWLRELREKLVEENGLYHLKNARRSVRFLVQGEVCTVFDYEGRVRRIHHVIFASSLESAELIAEELGKYGSLEVDGRPTLKMNGAELVEAVLSADRDALVIPAHVWTPWFSLFGARGGVDRVEECYGDKASQVYALETGLSSDPEMNWRWSALDRFTLISNSDSHSPWPWRLGREANIFNLKELSYREIADAIRSGDPEKFIMTIEVDPSYGKYHWSGHRRCGVAVPPEEARRLGGICPVCGKKLTKGVAERLEELADRPPGFKPEGKALFIRILPLCEIIATVLGKKTESKEVWNLYSAAIKKLGSELDILLYVPDGALRKILPPMVAELIVRMREGRVRVRPGFDGVYGQLIIEECSGGGQRKLEDFYKVS